jgi:DNA polymerase-3 subunit epsilon
VKKILGLDTETTGLDPHTGDKIIEVALLTYDADSHELIDSYITRIDPERSINPKAQEVHGIRYEELVGCPKFNDVAHEIVARNKDADLMVAHNLEFDAGFLVVQLAAAGVAMPNIAVFDTMKEARWATHNGKYPRLQELCFSLGVEYDTSAAHAATYDVDVMMQCLWKGAERGFYTLPEIVK